MAISRLPFDLTHEEREEAQMIMAELDIYPAHRPGLIAELVLLREIRTWAMAHRDRFPPVLRARILALGNRTLLRRAAADSLSEIDP